MPDRNLTHNDIQDVDMVKNEIRKYMGIDAGIAVALFIAFLVYYPKAPPTPPSASATIPRTNFKQGLIDLFTNKNVLLCTFAYSLSGGVFGAWQVSPYSNNYVLVLIVLINFFFCFQAVMTLNFAPLGVNDEEADRIGLVMVFACCVIGVSVAFITDHIRKHMKVYNQPFFMFFEI